MRIIGGHDYYDTARAYGEDPDLVLIRQRYADAETLLERDSPIFTGWDPSIRPIGERYWPSTHGGVRGYGSLNGYHYETSGACIFFAGKRYHGVHVEFDGGTPATQGRHYFWDLETYEAYLARRGLEIHRSRWRPEVEDWPGPRELTRRQLDWCVEHGVGIAVLDPLADRPARGRGEDLVHLNCDGLKERGFARLLDPYQAYQELSMFVGGVLPRSGNPMVELRGEDIMTQKHGMDRWSFRKPGKKGMY